MSPQNQQPSAPERMHSAPSAAGAVLVVGPPGSGRTETLIQRAREYVMHAGSAGAAEEILMLAPTRASADGLRDRFSEAIGAAVSTPPARAWHSYAFDILRRAHAEGLLPGVSTEPRLLAGPEQDVLIGEMLEAHARGLGSAPDWPADLHEAIGTRGFRREIREFLDRCAEFDLSSDHVRELGLSLNHPEWVAAADFRAEYDQLRRLRMPQAFDPSALIHEAASFVESHPDFVRREHERIRLVLVDDLQEATPAILRLLSALAPAAATTPPEILMTACTDTVVQGFRGARPELLSELDERLPAYSRLEVRQASAQYRLPPVIAAAVRRIGERVPVVAHARHERELPAVPEAVARESEASLNIVLTPSTQHELRLISQGILEEHIRGGRPLADMAVIVRDGSSLAAVKRHLESDGIPVTVPVAETPVREEPAVRPFLDALWLASGEPGDTGITQALSLLTSRLGGASPNRIRRIRQALRSDELRRGGHRSSDELMVEALNREPERGTDSALGVDQREPRGTLRHGEDPLERIRRVLSAGRRAMSEPGATADSVLWALWEASGLASVWRRAAQGSGPAAQRANRDLDAMLGLFEAAERFVDQQPGAGAREFLEYIDSQDLPMDTLAPRTPGRAAVSLTTPASAAGREWDWVHVAKVQQGSWPNTTLRGGLLSTPELSDVVLLGIEQAQRMTRRVRLRETRYDELRMFATAISRSRSRLIVSAVTDEEEEPSEFLDIVDPLRMIDLEPVRVRRPMTLRGLIAELRRSAQTTENPIQAEQAARQLARIARESTESGEPAISGAHPRDWWGLLPLSSQAEALNPDEPVTLSPSRLESIASSPLDWFVSASGAEAATDSSRSLGTLIHEIAQDFPEAPSHELRAELDRRFATLGLPDTWETDILYQRAVRMLEKFAAYAVDVRLKFGRRLAGVEGSFSVLVPGPARDAILTGRVDRLEVDELGRFVVIDLKTGKSAPSRKDLERHPQLAAYQVALDAGVGPHMADASSEPETLTLKGASLTHLSGGAALVQLGTGTKGYGVQEQAPLVAEDSWAVELVQRCAELIAHSRFQARHDDAASGPFSRGCRLPEICPLCSAGRQVTQP
ncbi:ATP-dependent DNA helicase [Kocuria massiliensis]|uniref:ATP-dependent DNA helicase n=1 Tax=Kocuria massiliensis TaxID=1926282 RepID=UPI001FE6CD27|nr:ATP-dependent DNA helicase [Kocuria massiliensis]